MAMSVQPCHFGMTTHGRSWGHTVGGAFAYGCGERVYCPVKDAVQDYTRRSGVEWWTLDSPYETPMLSSLSALAAGTEAAETRKNAWILRMISASLYHGLSREAMVIVGKRFAEWLSEKLTTTVCVALHRPTHGDHRNWHLHFYIATRELRPDGTYGRKIRELAVKRTASKLVKEMRKSFEHIQNAVLVEEGFNVRVSLGRSPDSDPQPKLGRRCTARERREAERAGCSTRGKGIAQVIEENGPITQIGNDLLAHRRRRRRRRERNIDLVQIDQSPVAHPCAAPTPHRPAIGHTPAASSALHVAATPIPRTPGATLAHGSAIAVELATAPSPRAAAIEHIAAPAITVDSVAAPTPHAPVIGHTPAASSALDVAATPIPRTPGATHAHSTAIAVELATAPSPRAPAIEHIAAPAITVDSVAAPTPHAPVIRHTPPASSALDVAAAPTPRTPSAAHAHVSAIAVELAAARSPRAPAIEHIAAPAITVDSVAAPTPHALVIRRTSAASSAFDMAAAPTPRTPATDDAPAASVPVDLPATLAPRAPGIEHALASTFVVKLAAAPTPRAPSIENTPAVNQSKPENERESPIDSTMVAVAPRAIEVVLGLAAIRSTYRQAAEQARSEAATWPGATTASTLGRTETATMALRAAPTPRAPTVPAVTGMAIARELVAAPTPAPIQMIEAARGWIVGRAKAAARPVRLLVGQVKQTLARLREELQTVDSPQDRHYLEGDGNERPGLVRRLTDMMAWRLAVPELTSPDRNERVDALHEMLDPELPRKHMPHRMPRPAMPVRSRRSAQYVAKALSDEFDRVQIEVHGASEDGSPSRVPTADEARRELYGSPTRHYANRWGEETLPKLLDPIVDEILLWEGAERRAQQANMQAREEAVRLRAQFVLSNDTAAAASRDSVRARQHAERYLQGADERPSLEKAVNDIAHERLTSTTAPPLGAIAREDAIFELLRPRTPDGAPITDDERIEHGNLAPVRTNAAARAVAGRLRWWIDTVQARTYGTLPGTSEPKPAPATDWTPDKTTRAKALSEWGSHSGSVMKAATKAVLEAEAPRTEREQSADIAPTEKQTSPRQAEPEIRTRVPEPAPTARPSLTPETPEMALATRVTTAPGAPVTPRESPEWEAAFRRYARSRLTNFEFTARTAKAREARIRRSIRTPEATENEPSSLLSGEALDAAAAILARRLDAFQVEYVGRTADGEPKSPGSLLVLDGDMNWDQNSIDDIVSLWQTDYEDYALREARKAVARVERESPTKTPTLARAPGMVDWRGPGR